MNEQLPNSIEKKENVKEKGKNIELVVSMIRHGRKDKGGKLSSQGSMEAEAVGKNKEIPLGGIKTYASTLERCEETAASIIRGIIKADGENKVFKNAKTGKISKTRYELAPPAWPEEIKKELKEKEKLGEEEVFKYFLTDPAIRPYLEHWSTGIAFLLNRYRKMPEYLNSGQKIELQHVTHDALVAYFLKQIAVAEGEDQKKAINFDLPENNIKPLEGFEFRINRDENREENIKIFFRDQEFKVNEEELNKLAGEFKENPYRGRGK